MPKTPKTPKAPSGSASTSAPTPTATSSTSSSADQSRHDLPRMSSAELDMGLGLPPSGLASPFHTPTSKRHASGASLRLEAGDITPFSTPRRRPRGPSVSLLAASPGASGAPGAAGGRSHRRNPSLGDVFARMTAVAAASAAAEEKLKEQGTVKEETEEREEPETEVEQEQRNEQRHVVGFGDLPIELVQYIHLLADNPALPMVSHYVRSSLTHASKTYIARYMLHQYRHSGPRSILTLALKRPIVDLAVAEEMVRLWDQQRGYSRVRHTSSSPNSSQSPPCTPSRPRTSAPPLEVTQLPRRLFRPKPLPHEPPIHPLIRWLFANWDFNLKGQQGYYPLARSVINQNHALVEFLLRRGANPNNKDAFALTAAIEKKDLRMVKLLVEPFGDVKESPVGAGKRRKFQDRMVILQTHVQHALNNGTPEIVDYFVHEKGATPNLNDIMAMGHEPVAKRRRRS